MTRLKQRIISEIESLDNPGILGQIFDFLRLVKKSAMGPRSNRKAVMSLAGSLSSVDAKEMEKIINEEFNGIEGEW
jgi:hypothetical protein